MKNNNVINLAGIELNFETAVSYMDDEIREKLHQELAPCEDQVFFTEYEKMHEAKYGEEWFLSKKNLTW